MGVGIGIGAGSDISKIITGAKKTNGGMNQIIIDAEKKRQERTKDLESRSKPLHELVIAERFMVNEAVAEAYGTSFKPYPIMGGSSLVYPGGFTSKLVLKVMPDNQSVPIRILNFDGISAVQAGDYISARIPRFEEEIVESEFFHPGPEGKASVFYLDRAFNPEEIAIELAILSENGKVLRIDRAVDYKDFVKE